MKLIGIRRNSLAYHVDAEVKKTFLGFEYASRKEEYIYLPNLRLLIKRNYPKYEFPIEDRYRILSWIVNYSKEEKENYEKECSVPVEN